MDGVPESLTPAQEALLPAYVKEWVGYGLSTDRADRALAEIAMKETYELAGEPWHGQIVWADSQVDMVLSDAILCVIDKNDKACGRLLKKPSTEPMGDLPAGVTIAMWRHAFTNVMPYARSYIGESATITMTDGVIIDRLSPFVLEKFWDQINESLSEAVNSFWEVHWLAFYAFLHEVCGADWSKLRGLWGLQKYAGWWLAREGIAYIAERPLFIHRTADGRLNSETGAAIAYPDGWGVFAINGVRLPRRVIEDIYSYTPEEILSTKNAEVRRIMMSRYGTGLLMQRGGGSAIDKSEFGTLWRMEVPGEQEPRHVAEVLNCSPEPDGTWKTYWLPVPPTCMTTRDAIAWTGFRTADDYAPMIET